MFGRAGETGPLKKTPRRPRRTRDGPGPSVHARTFPDAIIGSSDSHNVDEKKVVFAYQPVSLSEAVPSIFHCRGGFLLSGTVFPIMHVNTVRHYYARAVCICFHANIPLVASTRSDAFNICSSQNVSFSGEPGVYCDLFSSNCCLIRIFNTLWN